MEAITLAKANAMPAPTWHRLKMNYATIELPALEGAVCSVELEGDECVYGQPGALAKALDAYQVSLEAEGRPVISRLFEGEITEDNKLDVVALSDFELNNELLKRMTVAEAFETGMGDQADTLIRGYAADASPVVYDIAAGTSAKATLSIAGLDGQLNSVAIDIVVRAGATFEFDTVLRGDAQATGVVGTSIHLFADEGAQVTLHSMQTLPDGFVGLENLGLVLADNASVVVNQEVLGAGEAYVGLSGDLRGHGSKAQVFTNYLGSNTQVRDFNYVLRHRGRKTECLMDANGVLCGSSSKVLRGTIDLIQGCKGAEGTERETVLLADEGVKNKTVPTILCDEDDVAGNHGATIGHVQPEQFFYLASRGLSQNQAEAMFARAKVEDAVLKAASPAARSAAIAFGAGQFDNFEEQL